MNPIVKFFFLVNRKKLAGKVGKFDTHTHIHKNVHETRILEVGKWKHAYERKRSAEKESSIQKMSSISTQVRAF